ncbi:hypothetical protein EBS43_03280 [bacterium]|jgi:hypothetical protein|nr:hypothetical protein [bacterium]
MKKNLGLFVLLMTSLLLLLSPTAFAMNLAGLGLLTYPNGGSMGDPVFQTSGLKASYGSGLSLEYSIAKRWGLEIGIFSAERGMIYSDSTVQDQQVSFRTVTLPLLIRSTALKYFGFGFGAYYSRALGSAPLMNQVGSLKQDDTGIVVSARLKAPLLEPFSIVGDIRYLYGLTNLSPLSSAQIFVRDVQLLLGLDLKI